MDYYAYSIRKLGLEYDDIVGNIILDKQEMCKKDIGIRLWSSGLTSHLSHCGSKFESHLHNFHLFNKKGTSVSLLKKN